MTATEKMVPPEGLTEDEVEAWKESLPKPAAAETGSTPVAERVASLESRMEALEKMLNVDPATQAEDLNF